MQAKSQKPVYRFERVDLTDIKTCETIKRLHRRCFPDDDLLEPDSGYWWVVKHERKIIGFCAMRRSVQWSDTGYLWRSGVIDGHRGHGLQRKMIRVREKLARKLNWAYMISDTTQNPQSSNNLIKCGYLMYDPTWPYGTDSMNYWKKRL